VAEKFFGEYLADQGLVESHQVREAIELQKGRNPGIGEVAMRRGWLTAGDVERILAEQRTRNEMFGEIAVRRELLTPEQVDSLLEEQASNRIFLGEALLELGHIDRATLTEQLARFEAYKTEQRLYLARKLQHLPVWNVLSRILDVTRAYLYRLGIQVKIDDYEDLLPRVTPEARWVEHRFSDGRRSHVGFLFSPTLSRELESLPSQDGDGSVGGHVMNIMRICSDELRSEGIGVFPGTMLDEQPKDFHKYVVVRLRAEDEMFRLAYLYD
jgi:hypothetical protein